MTNELLGQLLAGGLFLLAGAALHAFARRSLAAELGPFLGAPAVRIADALARSADGPVRLRGTIVPIDTFDDPDTRRPCVALRYAVQGVTHRHGDARVVDSHSGGLATPFLLDDGTGRVLVDPSLPSIVFGRPPPSGEAGRGRPSVDAASSGRTIASSSALLVEEPVTVVGRVVAAPEATRVDARGLLRPAEGEDRHDPRSESLLVTPLTLEVWARGCADEQFATRIFGWALAGAGAGLLAHGLWALR